MINKRGKIVTKKRHAASKKTLGSESGFDYVQGFWAIMLRHFGVQVWVVGVHPPQSWVVSCQHQSLKGFQLLKLKIRPLRPLKQGLGPLTLNLNPLALNPIESIRSAQ